MTSPSLMKRLEALEGSQNPDKAIILWKPPNDWPVEEAEFEARLAAAKAAHPNRQIMIFAWGEPS